MIYEHTFDHDWGQRGERRVSVLLLERKLSESQVVQLLAPEFEPFNGYDGTERVTITAIEIGVVTTRIEHH